MSGIRAGKFGGNLAREGSNFIEVVPSNQSQRVEDLGACAGLSGASVVRIVMTTDRVTQVVNALGPSGTEASSRRPVRRTRRRYQFLVHGRGSPFHARYDLGLPRDISPWIKASATACSPPPEQRGCHGMRLRLGILEHGLLVWH